MAKFQFRKRFSITKGVSLNLSKKGLGLSTGPRGMKISRSAQGRITGSLGIPGSGLSYRSRLDATGEQSTEEIDSPTFLDEIADKTAYISKHGQVFTNKEMRPALLLHGANFLLCILWPISVMFWTFEYLVNPLLFALVLVLILLIRETRKNKRIWYSRVREHLKDCKHE